MRRLIAGTGWKMNNGVRATRDYAGALAGLLPMIPGHDRLDLFVLPPFTSLGAAADAFAPTAVAWGGQNMHEDEWGSWTGEVSAAMLVELGCRYVELAHSERLAQFGETYEAVRRKTDRALAHGLVPILCLGELADERARADAVLRDQIMTVLGARDAAVVPGVVLAYEPRWAIGGAAAADPGYVADRHGAIRALLKAEWGGATANATRVIYGGSVDARNGPALVALPDVDGLFVGRAAWTAEGFAAIVRVVAEAAETRFPQAR